MRHLRAEGGVSAIVGECGKPSASWAAEGARTERWHVFVPVRWHVPAQVVTWSHPNGSRCPRPGNGGCPHQRQMPAARRQVPAPAA